MGLKEYITYKNMCNKYVILVRHGKFYKTFHDDALILSYLCNYKYHNNSVGFPDNVLEACLAILNKKGLTCYICHSSSDFECRKSSMHRKYDINYNKVLFKAKKYNKSINMCNELNMLINRLIMLDNKYYDIIKEYLNEL